MVASDDRSGNLIRLETGHCGSNHPKRSTFSIHATAHARYSYSDFPKHHLEWPAARGGQLQAALIDKCFAQDSSDELNIAKTFEVSQGVWTWRPPCAVSVSRVTE